MVLMITTHVLSVGDPSLPVTSPKIWLNLKITVAVQEKRAKIQRCVRVVDEEETSPAPSSTLLPESADREVCHFTRRGNLLISVLCIWTAAGSLPEGSGSKGMAQLCH